jgi:hypothetical protein
MCVLFVSASFALVARAHAAAQEAKPADYDSLMEISLLIVDIALNKYTITKCA